MPHRSAATVRRMPTIVLPADPFWLIMAIDFMVVP